MKSAFCLELSMAHFLKKLELEPSPLIIYYDVTVILISWNFIKSYSPIVIEEYQ